MQEAWEGFKEGIWTGEVDVRDFIQKNYTPYEGDESFLAGPTERTKELWGEVLDLLLKEREQGHLPVHGHLRGQPHRGAGCQRQEC